MLFLLDTVNTLASTTTETNSFLNSELFAALVGSCFTIIGVVIGNISAKRTAKSQEQMRLLAEFYSEVFAAFTDSAPFVDIDKRLSFVIAAEKAKLLCPKESENILSVLIHETTEDDPSPDTCALLMVKLRESAKKDLRQH